MTSDNSSHPHNLRGKYISFFSDYINNLPYDILVDESHTIYLDGEEIKTFRRNIEAFAPWLRTHNECRDPDTVK
jgi:hypothetical protein